MHSPRREPVEAGNNLLAQAFAIEAAGKTGKRRARERPVCAQHIVHHRFQGNGFALEERCGLLERRLVQEFARVGGVLRDGNELAFKLSQLDAQGLLCGFQNGRYDLDERGLGRGWIARA